MTDPAPRRSFSSEAPASPSLRNNLHMANSNSALSSHRSSFAENHRPHPPSPRTHRHPSMTQAAVQELINHPTSNKPRDPQFVGRDWRQISVGELVSKDDVRFVELNTGVEDATKLLIESGSPNVVLVRDEENPATACRTFDYNDLNAYLLVVLGLASPTEELMEPYSEIAKKAREGTKIPLKEVMDLEKKEPIVFLSEKAGLAKAIETFGGGVHRLLITEDGTGNVIGILSQLRLVKFLWDNGACFPVIDNLYPVILRDLAIGSQYAVAINGDRPLTDALKLMHSEGLTSLAVVDNALNVIGNISSVDVKLLTNTSSLPLLNSSCMSFVSLILSERGVENGKDSFPVFHVNPYSTLAHTVAKLVATKSHRMWVVEAASPSPSAPATPSATPATLSIGAAPASPSLRPTHPGAMSVSAMPESRISGRLTGVISLTDVMNLFARQSGLHPVDPSEQRARRRRSSSSSIRPSLERPSIDSARNSSIDLRR